MLRSEVQRIAALFRGRRGKLELISPDEVERQPERPLQAVAETGERISPPQAIEAATHRLIEAAATVAHEATRIDNRGANGTIRPTSTVPAATKPAFRRRG